MVAPNCNLSIWEPEAEESLPVLGQLRIKRETLSAKQEPKLKTEGQESWKGVWFRVGRSLYGEKEPKESLQKLLAIATWEIVFLNDLTLQGRTEAWE